MHASPAVSECFGWLDVISKSGCRACLKSIHESNEHVEAVTFAFSAISQLEPVSWSVSGELPDTLLLLSSWFKQCREKRIQNASPYRCFRRRYGTQAFTSVHVNCKMIRHHSMRDLLLMLSQFTPGFEILDKSPSIKVGSLRLDVWCFRISGSSCQH